MVNRRTLFHFRRRSGRGSVSKTSLSPALITLTLIEPLDIAFKWVDGFRKGSGRLTIKQDKSAQPKSTNALPPIRNVSFWKNVMQIPPHKNGNGRNFIFKFCNQRIRDRSANKNLVFLFTLVILLLVYFLVVRTLLSPSVSFLFRFSFSLSVLIEV